jgi:hypothetical protein
MVWHFSLRPELFNCVVSEQTQAIDLFKPMDKLFL